MSGRTVISVRELGKRYQLGEMFSTHTLRDAIANGAGRLVGRSGHGLRRQARDFWALKDVSFDVAEGEVLGIIGANGAGKSTLLKILSQITEPTEGEVRVRGRVASLLEVGTGFHPELSGRENVLMNGAILGMTQAEIRRKFDEIVEFAGVREFIDTPVKRYSSGMSVRLGFAVAAHLESEILVIDEILAVGDQAFQRRCLGKMDAVARSGRTVLFVSHNMAAVEALCTRALLIGQGHALQDGNVESCIAQYANASAAGCGEIDYSSRGGWIQRVRLLDEAGTKTTSVPIGRDLIIEADLQGVHYVPCAVVAFIIRNYLGQRVVTCNTKHQTLAAIELDGCTTVGCRLPGVRLSPGPYQVDVAVGHGSEQCDLVEGAVRFEIAVRDLYGTGTLPKPANAVLHPEIEWYVRPQESSLVEIQSNRVSGRCRTH